MGTFHVGCEIISHTDRARTVRIAKMLVDTGSEYTWVDEALLRKLRIAPEKKDLQFVMANGQTITRQVGFAIIRVNGAHTTDEVIFAHTGDLQLLGGRTLEGLNLRVDSRSKRLVAGGPLPARRRAKSANNANSSPVHALRTLDVPAAYERIRGYQTECLRLRGLPWRRLNANVARYWERSWFSACS
ncbi:MAG: retroviral-like aspartic protease family protein [Phycisphaerae bacterium]